jgi:DNA anti-recombination protein RmuC
MAKKTISDIDKIFSKIESIDNKLSNDISDIKIILLSLDHKVGLILDKIQQFEIVAEDDPEIQDNEQEFNEEWSPYDSYEEDYDDYNEDE